MSHSNIAQTSHWEFFLSICPGIWKSHLYISQGFFVSKEAKKTTNIPKQGLVLVCNGLYQVNMFLTTKNSRRWHPFAVDELWGTEPSEYPPCFFFFRRGFASQRLDLLHDLRGKYQKQRLTSWTIYYSPGETWQKHQEFNSRETRIIQLVPRLVKILEMMSPVWITLGWEEAFWFMRDSAGFPNAGGNDSARCVATFLYIFGNSMNLPRVFFRNC